MQGLEVQDSHQAWREEVEKKLAGLFSQCRSAEAKELISSRRLFHGRGGYYPGLEFLTIDVYQPVVQVTFFSLPDAAWEENFFSTLVAMVTPYAELTAIVLRRRYQSPEHSQLIYGGYSKPVVAQRQQTRFYVDFEGRQNTGFFLDMEPGRRWLEERAKGKRILNLFSYTCAFSVVALAAGAQEVVNVDMSKQALTQGRENHRLNGLESGVVFMPLNILKSWSRICRRTPFDTVIIDPPSFQKGSFVASRDYPKVVRRIPQLLKPGGEVLACLNAPELDCCFLKDVFANECDQCLFVERLAPHPDFPDRDAERQLKLLVYRYSSK